MNYTVRIAAPPTKFLEKLRDQSLRQRLTLAIRNLGENPRPTGCVKLSGEENIYRVRVSDYRIVYQIQDEQLFVLIVGVGHRREIYR